MSTVLGDGAEGCTATEGAVATAVSLDEAGGMAFDAAGDLFVAAQKCFQIYKVDLTAGTVSIVGGTGTDGYSGDGGAATAAEFGRVTDVAFGPAGNLFITDRTNFVVRRIDMTTGIVTTIAGTGTEGTTADGGLATAAELGELAGVVVDDAGNVIFTDPGDARVRRVDAVTGILSTVAGTGTAGFSGDGGPATAAEVSFPGLLDVDDAGNLYFSDIGNQRVRIVEGAATPPPATCNGLEVTIEATDGDDDLAGTAGDDVVDLGAGDDSFDGGAGNDTVCGGLGKDVILGGAGDDRLFGGAGRDLLFGGDGDDLVNGQAGRDLVNGGDGSDRLLGRGGDDSLRGGRDTDIAVFRKSGGPVSIDLSAGTGTGEGTDTLFKVEEAVGGRVR